MMNTKFTFKLILELLKNEKLYAKISKCEFWLQEVQFPGHVVDQDGIHVDPSKVESVKNWKTSKGKGRVESPTDDEFFSTKWKAFGRDTHDLGSFGEETDEITDLHQDSPRSIAYKTWRRRRRHKEKPS
ncbi:hypothetical protein Tco_0357588 [Tanacetum coccineum]